MRKLYSFLLYVALPFLFLRLVLRSRHNPAYLKRWLERLGVLPGGKLPGCIWVHAVSLGEVIAATPLIKGLLQQYSHLPVLVTTTTPTGSAQVLKQFGTEVLHCYLPFDLPIMINRFLEQARPQVGIIMETELWPNLLDCCEQRDLPLLLANGRLSPKSAKTYQLIASYTKRMLNSFTWVAAQSQLDGDRFLALGLAKDHLAVTGNIKFDLQLSTDLKQKGADLRATLAANRPIWIVASTHEGEDGIILQALHKILQACPELLLILVPRHPERFTKVAQLCEEQGFKVARRSLQQLPTADTQIYLGDTMGEMMLLYAASDVALVAGSLMPIGGHNLLEPAALGLPILSGPQLHNFTYVAGLLQQANALEIVSNEEQIAEAVIKLLADPKAAQAMGQRALAVVDANRGALAKHLQLVKAMLTDAAN